MKMRTKKQWIPLAIVAACAAGPSWAQNGITDLGVLGGTTSSAYGVSADGGVVVGLSNTSSSGSTSRPFSWTQAGGMQELDSGNRHASAQSVSADGSVVVGGIYGIIGGSNWTAVSWTQDGLQYLTLPGGVTSSSANDVSSDGSVMVGDVYNGTWHAARWTQAGAQVNLLGELNNGAESQALGVSADGGVAVGMAKDGAAGNAYRAFRWTQAGGMVSLGVLNGGTASEAYDVSGDGSVAVGRAKDGAAADAYRAFRWTQASGMVSLGVLNSGTASEAKGVSADGRVVVGTAKDGAAGNVDRAFRWTQATGMKTVEDWLRASGVSVPTDITSSANATSSDGSVVVGQLTNGHAFIARGGSGLVTLADVQDSLGAAAIGGGMAISAAGTILNGAHSRPLSRRVAVGKKVFWVAGDWGTDDHGLRSGDLGLAEVGGGLHLGSVQLNASLGQTWAKQNLTLNGTAKAGGTYLLAEALIPVSGNLWATVGGYGHWGDADLRRGYLNAGAQDYSTGTPDVNTWGLRARIDWENARRVAGADFSPYADITYSEAKLDAYTETGGGFPAKFDARKDKATELRLGVNASRPLTDAARLVGTLEAAHRFENTGARTVGQVIGLFGFDLAGPANKQDWLRAGVGVEGKLAEGVASLTLNATTRGELPNMWLAASWQKVF
ncbi:MAG: autotransporter domain-containing protein [Sulfuricella sp.]|nr:autotransporter domain-containing protein [Sulfuricella sp.]